MENRCEKFIIWEKQHKIFQKQKKKFTQNQNTKNINNKTFDNTNHVNIVNTYMNNWIEKGNPLYSIFTIETLNNSIGSA